MKKIIRLTGILLACSLFTNGCGLRTAERGIEYVTETKDTQSFGSGALEDVLSFLQGTQEEEEADPGAETVGMNAEETGTETAAEEETRDTEAQNTETQLPETEDSETQNTEAAETEQQTAETEPQAAETQDTEVRDAEAQSTAAENAKPPAEEPEETPDAPPEIFIPRSPAEEFASENAARGIAFGVTHTIQGLVQAILSADGETAEAAEAESAEAEAAEDNSYDIVFFGDSQIENAWGSGGSIPEMTSNKVNADSVLNFGCGGSCAAVAREYQHSSYHRWNAPTFNAVIKVLTGELPLSHLDNYHFAQAEIDRFDASRIDCYVIEYGYNDFQSGHDPVNEEWEEDPSAFANALHAGIRTLKEISPDAMIVLSTPCYAYFSNAERMYIGDAYTVDKGYGTLAEYAYAAQHVAEKENIVFFDAFSGTEFNLNAYHADEYLEKDGVHLTPAGRVVYAEALARKINAFREGTQDEYREVLRIEESAAF